MSHKFYCTTFDGDAFLLPRNKVGEQVILNIFIKKGHWYPHCVGEQRPFPFPYDSVGTVITRTHLLGQRSSQVRKTVAVHGTADLIMKKRKWFT